MTTTIIRNPGIEPVELAGAVPRELRVSLVDAGLRGRQIGALVLRLGLDGTGARTLAEAGEASGYTRERVRQLEHRLRTHVSVAPPALPATRAAVEILEASAPVGLEPATRLLAARGLVSPRFDLGGLVASADVFGIGHELELTGKGVCSARDAAVLPQALTAARRLQRCDGVVRLARLTNELRDGGSFVALRRLLDLHRDVIWLDDARNWFVVKNVRSRVAPLIRKMLTITETLTLREVERGLRRSFRPVIVPLSVLAPLCELFPWLVVDRHRQIVTRKVTVETRRMLTPVERELVDLFANHGPELGFTEVVELGLRRGLNRPTIGVYLTRSPLFERIRRGRYVLRGTSFVAVPS